MKPDYTDISKKTIQPDQSFDDKSSGSTANDLAKTLSLEESKGKVLSLMESDDEGNRRLGFHIIQQDRELKEEIRKVCEATNELYKKLKDQGIDLFEAADLSSDLCQELKEEEFYFIPPNAIKELMLFFKEWDAVNISWVDLWILTQLKKLMIFGDDVKEIPPTIEKLVNLENFFISSATLEKLPDELWTLKKMKVLTLNLPKLKVLTPKIGSLQNLEGFIAGWCGFEDLPDELWTLKKLDRLWLQDNKIKSVSPLIWNLTHLEEFNLNNNQLKTLPEEVINLSALIHWRLDDNDLSYEEKEKIRSRFPASVKIYF